MTVSASDGCARQVAALKTWADKLEGLAFDELIEDIGPHQCRDYTRIVIGHLLRYLALYETPKREAEIRARLLPETWHARMLDDPSY